MNYCMQTHCLIQEHREEVRAAIFAQFPAPLPDAVRDAVTNLMIQDQQMGKEEVSTVQSQPVTDTVEDDEETLNLPPPPELPTGEKEWWKYLDRIFPYNPTSHNDLF